MRSVPLQHCTQLSSHHLFLPHRFFSFLHSDDSKFAEAVRVLLTWVERGEVNRRNANNFYSMIQSSNSHIRRLMSEKAAHEKEMEEAKEKFKNALAGILVQCECSFTDVASVSNPSKLLTQTAFLGIMCIFSSLGLERY